MQKGELYPELADYIYAYCQRYFTEQEFSASKNFIYLPKAEYHKSRGMYDMMLERKWISNDSEVMKLMEGGFQEFKTRVTMRVYNEHWHELPLNTCPQCGKIARTPEAKQCRFCFYKWHDKK